MVNRKPFTTRDGRYVRREIVNGKEVLVPVRPSGKPVTQPPRTRPGATYPGGKHMRRSLAKLAMRKTMREQGMSANVRNQARHSNVPGSRKA